MIKLYQEELLPITSITIAERNRDLGDLTSLKNAIDSVGLLQPIVVSPDNVLCAGERRLTACKELGWTEIPVRRAPSGTTADDQLIIELLENIERKEFQWFEEIDLILRLHEMWVAEAEADPKAEDWSARQTAAKLNCSPGGLSTNLEIAKAIKSFPELRDLSSKAKAREAYKKIKQNVSAILSMKALPKEDQERIAAMSAESMAIATPSSPSGDETPADADTPAVPRAMHDDTTPDISTRGCSRCESPEAATDARISEAIYRIAPWDKFLQEVPDNSLGMVDLDPPYAIDFDATYGKASNISTQNPDWTVDTLQAFYTEALPILYNKMLDDSWCVIWTGKEHAIWTNEIAAQAGFATQQPGIWAKPSGSCNSPKTTMTSCYEVFLLLRKGKATFNLPSMSNVLQFSASHRGDRIHQWEKPMELCDYLLKAMGRPGTYYLSLFAGSGNAMVAASLAGMTPMGCDIQDKYLHLFYEHLSSYYN